MQNIVQKIKNTEKNKQSKKLKNNLNIKDAGQRCRYIRRLTGLNIKEFSQALNINKSILERIERGETNLSHQVAQWISSRSLKYKILVSVDWLISGKGESPINNLNIEPVIKNNNFTLQKNEKLFLMMDSFEKIYQNSVVLAAKDDTCDPFKKGDIVGGIWGEKPNYKMCIVKTNIRMFIGYILVINDNYYIYKKKEQQLKLISNVEKIAPITFHLST